MAEKDKATTMVLNLQCSKCFKKVKKLLCIFPEIRDQTYDDKSNEVTIKVVCCSPQKIRDKLCCKGGGCIKNIEIKDYQKLVTTMELNVDLQCSKCYKKVKKLLCKFHDGGHLFLNCKVTSQLWTKCCNWWGIQAVMTGNVWDAFYQHEGFSVSTKMSKSWEIVWFALVWTVWTTRNKKLFNRGEVDVNRMFDLVQARSFL